MNRIYLVLGLLAVCSPVNAVQIAGWVEQVRVDSHHYLDAKIDTGAKHSSLHYDKLEAFEKNGQSWVRLSLTNRDGHHAQIEAPVRRDVKIRRHYGELQPRKIVLLNICMGNVEKQVQVSLVDRSGLNFPILIGRSFLRGHFMVDPAKRRVLKPDCPGHESK